MKKKILAILSIALLLLLASPMLLSTAASPPKPGIVYTIDNQAANSALEFQTGPGPSLTLVGTFSSHGSGTGAKLASQGAVTLTQDGRWLLVVDAGSNQISVFHVNNDGSLTFTGTAASRGKAPLSITEHDGLVYVLDNGTSTTPGNIAGFSLTHSGILTFLPGSVQTLSGAPNTSPEQIGFSNDGNVLVVTEKAAGVIDTYVVGSGGVAGSPASIPSNSAGPYGFAFTSQGYLILSEAVTGTLSSYSVSDDGSLRTLSGSIPDFGLAPCWVAVSPDGHFAYTTNAHGGTISGYDVSGTGTISLFSSVASKAMTPTLDLAFGGSDISHNQFLYVLNGNSITAFRAYGDGSVTQFATAGGLPASATGLAAL
ncbi:MAG TPA: beta-propeller fold lactonase family protein [Nitrososphaerales archaeon]|nr:beta-propeller fold lactonase family protein [Nitrososphaerales archaeon]